jgi:hypothetical protein
LLLLKTENRKLKTIPGVILMGEHCILVIEDQEDLAELYETSLQQAG